MVVLQFGEKGKKTFIRNAGRQEKNRNKPKKNAISVFLFSSWLPGSLINLFFCFSN